MKLLCILTSFVLVNVLVAVLDEYKRQVIITNKYIELARVRLPDIIRDAILYGNYTMEKLALMIAVPESRDINGYLNISCQYNMRGEIKAIAAIVAPEINEDDYKDVTLQDLGSARRKITTEAIITLIRSVIGNEDDPIFIKFSYMCRLLGLFRSVRRPSAYIENATATYGICTLDPINSAIILYTTHDCKIWEVKANGNLILPLSDQLNNWDQELQR